MINSEGDKFSRLLSVVTDFQLRVVVVRVEAVAAFAKFLLDARFRLLRCFSFRGQGPQLWWGSFSASRCWCYFLPRLSMSSFRRVPATLKRPRAAATISQINAERLRLETERTKTQDMLDNELIEVDCACSGKGIN
jgi:hypothetical protein